MTRRHVSLLAATGTNVLPSNCVRAGFPYFPPTFAPPLCHKSFWRRRVVVRPHDRPTLGNFSQGGRGAGHCIQEAARACFISQRGGRWIYSFGYNTCC
jgi:hypothetical protein